MPLSERMFQLYAREILRLIHKGRFGMMGMRGAQLTLYDFLTKVHFDKDVYESEFLQHEKEFAMICKSVSHSSHCYALLEGGWLYVDPFGYAGDKPREKKDFRGFSITPKRYYTLQFPAESALATVNEINRFVSSLCELALKLAELSKANRSDINFKVLGSLKRFLNHRDMLVIHYVNRRISEKIHQIVLAHLHQHGFQVQTRHHRVDAGFDMKNNKLESELILQGSSHSYLVSFMLSARIYTNKDRLAQLTEEQVALWLKEDLQKINSWNARTFAKQIHRLMK